MGLYMKSVIDVSILFNKSTTEHPYSMLHYASCFCSLPLSLPWVSQGGTRSLMNRSFSSALALASFLKSSAALAMINAFNQIPTSFTYILAQIYFNLSEILHATPCQLFRKNSWNPKKSMPMSTYITSTILFEIFISIHTTYQNAELKSCFDWNFLCVLNWYNIMLHNL